MGGSVWPLPADPWCPLPDLGGGGGSAVPHHNPPAPSLRKPKRLSRAESCTGPTSPSRPPDRSPPSITARRTGSPSYREGRRRLPRPPGCSSPCRGAGRGGVGVRGVKRLRDNEWARNGGDSREGMRPGFLRRPPRKREAPLDRGILSAARPIGRAACARAT